MDSLSSFKKIGIAEGTSFILLLCLAMPLKYMMDFPLAVKYLGWAHGVLFILYVISLYLVSEKYKWSWGKRILGFIAALLPLGPFIFHRKLED